MTAQTRNEFLLGKIAERLGVVRPTDDQVFSPDPFSILQGLVQLLADPAAAKARVAEFADAAAKADAAAATAKQALADRDTALADLASAQKRHDEKLAASSAAHTVELQKRTLAVDQREKAVAEREGELEETEKQLTADRARLAKRLEAIRAAAA